MRDHRNDAIYFRKEKSGLNFLSATVRDDDDHDDDDDDDNDDDGRREEGEENRTS